MKLLLLAISLCADCFAVSLCSSITLKKVDFRSVAIIALIFAIIQSGLLLVGWAFGYAFVGLLQTVSHIIGFLLLLYVGGSMILEGIKKQCNRRNLNGWKNIILGGIATSIDAITVGVSQSMSNMELREAFLLFIYTFITTALAVVAGILSGNAVGCSKKLGRSVEIIGGAILIAIGISILF